MEIIQKKLILVYKIYFKFGIPQYSLHVIEKLIMKMINIFSLIAKVNLVPF